MQLMLNEKFTKKEVFLALKQMHPTNGMTLIFYQKYWDVLGTKVTEAVLTALRLGTIPPSLNHTFITLIPKNKTPKKVSDYRPISLCNFLYKIVAKVLANRLKMILPHVISSTQSAFYLWAPYN